MDFDLKHLGQTLAIGGFAVYATIFIIKVCRAKWVPKFFEAEEKSIQLQHIAVYWALILGAGVLLEDVSKEYAARRGAPLGWFFSRIFDSDSELRLRSLFKVEFASETNFVVTPKPILIEMLRMGYTNAVTGPYVDWVRSAMTNTNRFEISGTNNVKRFTASVNGLFFDAKDTVYKEATYFQELSEISDRVDFTRSFLLLCACFTCGYFLLGLGAFVQRVANIFGVDPVERKKLILLGLLFAVGMYLSRVAYVSESGHFNLRVFGYYITLKMQESRPVANTTSLRKCNSILWAQASGEHDASYSSVFEAAKPRMLDNLTNVTFSALYDMQRLASASHLKPAVIFDIDETILDNALFQGQLFIDRAPFSDELWQQWINLSRSPALTGAAGFLKFLNTNGVKCIFITNRGGTNDAERALQREATLRNLQHVFGPEIVDGPDVLLMRGDRPDWGSDKASRREYVAGKYRCIGLFGDDLGDFVSVEKLASSSARKSFVNLVGSRWGHAWFMLPNSMYGSFERTFTNDSVDDIDKSILRNVMGFHAF